MELRQLEYFRAIVDAGTISGAARVLHMTQPPLKCWRKSFRFLFSSAARRKSL